MLLRATLVKPTSGGDMDPALKALCLEVIGGDVDSEQFAYLLMKTGVSVESLEWEIAARLMGKGEAQSWINKEYGTTIQ